MPENLLGSRQLSEDEQGDVMAFAGKPWPEVTCQMVEDHSEAVFWFSPEAFCYYLPGLLSCGVAAGRPNLLAYDSILGMLDRSPEPAYWDDFFVARWPSLSVAECEACQCWLRWLESVGSAPPYENTYARALKTLDLLKERSAAP